MIHRTKLSVVIPAFNEVARLPAFLGAARVWLEQGYPMDHEVIIVDDGSTDGLEYFARSQCALWPALILLRHNENQGKGAALRTGLSAAKGELVLLADADGAAPIEDANKLIAALEEGADMAVGSRCSAMATRSWSRSFIGAIFARLVRWMFALPVRDTQCGFKMLRSNVWRDVGPLCRETGFLFELEAIAWAHLRGHVVCEVPISWREVPGSKVRLFFDAWEMLRGLVRIRRSLCNGRCLSLVASTQSNAGQIHGLT
ncbi:MAG: glycosyltransferase family 2 protein [Acidobacteria bacterium]|nr:glycosyltransferase family 2 protein [Acidobacteriota bacterium]